MTCAKHPAFSTINLADNNNIEDNYNQELDDGSHLFSQSVDGCNTLSFLNQSLGLADNTTLNISTTNNDNTKI